VHSAASRALHQEQAAVVAPRDAHHASAAPRHRRHRRHARRRVDFPVVALAERRDAHLLRPGARAPRDGDIARGGPGGDDPQRRARVARRDRRRDVSGRAALRGAVNLSVRDRVRAALRLLLVRGDGPRVHLFDRRVRTMGEWERRELS
jgi:hypothetical protein